MISAPTLDYWMSFDVVRAWNWHRSNLRLSPFGPSKSALNPLAQTQPHNKLSDSLTCPQLHRSVRGCYELAARSMNCKYHPCIAVPPMGTGCVVLHRYSFYGGCIREKCWTWFLQSPIFIMGDARLHAGFHRAAQDRASDSLNS